MVEERYHVLMNSHKQMSKYIEKLEEKVQEKHKRHQLNKSHTSPSQDISKPASPPKDDSRILNESVSSPLTICIPEKPY